MATIANQPRCDVCGNKLVKNGKTGAGRTRWRCKNCGASSTVSRPDIIAKAQFTGFYHWATGKHSIAELGIPRRTFHRTTAWCWQVQPHLEQTGEQHRYLMLDGTYFNGYCALTAFNGKHIIDWQFCNREKVASWTLMLQRMTPSQIAVIDGNGALESVITALWPEVKIQRCFFHIRQTMIKHLTLNPRTVPGQQLLTLTRALMKVETKEQAEHWTEQFYQWQSMHAVTLKERTYAKGKSEPRPWYVRPNQTWWYTHINLRRGEKLFDSLLKKGQLFQWLDLALEGEVLPRTTSPLEGGINAGIKDQLRLHRGLTPEHSIALVRWYLYRHVETPKDPWSFVQQRHWAEKPSPKIIKDEPIGPVLYDRHFSWDDGNGVQRGWGGRR
ncbi:IS1249 family transposase [Glutamicibacter sp. AOP5-A2-18]|uniref:IS1249 family transposase n=1 Tax=Glutamicibacter sp. AOP5-A2-18 TaxID=3457656 RepID=UPI0040340ACF